MMLHQLTIYKKMQDLLIYLYPIISRLPRSEKYTMGKRIELTSMEIVEGIIQANYEINKIETLAKLRVRLEILQLEVRILKSLGIVSMKQYLFTSRTINELKRILFGWMKSVKNAPLKSDENAFGNYYFGIDYEANVENEEPEHSEENLKRELKKQNEKVDTKSTKDIETINGEDIGGLWLFGDEGKDNGKEQN
jgi:hypothetical protein